jgi:KaiC/GvpD/RAD55 family RecA-like ATPase
MNTLPKIPTGIQGLDTLLGDGLIPGAFCILDGDAMSATHLAALNFAANGLNSGEGCVYLCTKDFGENLLQELGAKGASLKGNLLSIVDAYSALADPQVRDGEIIQYVSFVSDLPKLSHLAVTAMSKLFSNGTMQQRIVIESVDTMIMYLPVQAIYRFLFFLKAKIKSFKGIALVLFSSDLCPENDRRMLLELADVVIKMESSSNLIKVFVPSKAPASGRFHSEGDILKVVPHGRTVQ